MVLPANVRLSLSLQLVFSLLTLGFGLLGLQVAPKPGRSVRLGAWYLTGTTFALNGALALLSAVMAVGAAFVAPTSRVMEYWLHYEPIANDARAFSVFGFTLVLAWAMLHRRRAPAPRAVAALLAVLLVIGSVVGVLEGTYEAAKQFAVMSVLSTASVVALFVALYAGLVQNSMDWHLWAALGTYAVRETTNTVVGVAVAVGLLSNEWMPMPRTILWLGSLSMAVMIAFTMIRLGWTRGMEPPALLERLRG
jgi:hypothetical protein